MEKPLTKVIIAALLTYAFQLAGLWLGLLIGGMSCEASGRADDSSLGCLNEGLGGGAVGLLVALVLLALVGIRLKMRWWWLPALLGLYLICWQAGLLRVGMPIVLLMALAVPWLAAFAAAPRGTPTGLRKAAGVLGLVLLLLIGTVSGLHGAREIREREAQFEVAGPLYAPPAGQGLRLRSPWTGQQSANYYLVEGDTIIANVSLTRQVQECGVSCHRLGGEVFVIRLTPDDIEYFRTVPEGQIRLKPRKQQDDEPKLAQIMHDMEPISAKELLVRGR